MRVANKCGPGFSPASLLTHPTTRRAMRTHANRLTSIAQGGGGTRAYAYDAAGNVVSDSRGAGYAYTYDAAGRMATMSINGVLQAEYKYDFAGRQAIRKLPQQGVTLHSVFDSDGRRIAEYNEATGALVREYVWLGWSPVAVIEGGVVSFVRSDHIGRPVFATNASGTKVWTASYLPFGGVRTTTGTPMTARFPGQWFQSESGLHQNWMRDYDPTTGRYLQADPLGLVDGASVYGYAGQNPGQLMDPRGLAACTYSISTQVIRCSSAQGQYSLGPDGVKSGIEGRCQNNPECSGEESVGPIPPGEYTMRYTEKYKGAYWLDEGRWTRWTGGVEGRGGFYLHKGTISAGCITVRPDHPDWDGLMGYLAGERSNTMTVVP